MIAEFKCRADGMMFIGSPDNETEIHEHKVDNEGVDHGECGAIGDLMGVWKTVEDYCEGCEGIGLMLNAKGYCGNCVDAARRSGNLEAVLP